MSVLETPPRFIGHSMTGTESAHLKPPKPKLRGVSHLFAAIGAIPLSVNLVQGITLTELRGSVVMYAICLVLLFSVSALYHIPFWKPHARSRLRRLDRSMIYVFIAGTYTPLCTVLEAHLWGGVLPLVWAAAIGGIILTLLNLGLPRYVRAAPYVVLGWGALVLMPTVWEHLGETCFWLILAGGGPYTYGTLAYARKKPNPWPRIFGYHEIFHIMVVVAAGLHYSAIHLVVTA